MLRLGPVNIGYGKDCGAQSTVWGYFLECKKLASVVLLRFEPGSREAYHSHAFESWSLLLKGQLVEKHLDESVNVHTAPCFVRTRRATFHKVVSCGRSWVLSFRGPWANEWSEWTAERGHATLTHGRRQVRGIA